MRGTYLGHIALEGEDVDVALEVLPDSVRLATLAAEIGSWPLAACRIRRGNNGTFHLVLDGEQVAFAPSQPEEFSRVVEGIFDGSHEGSDEDPVADVDPDGHDSEGPVPAAAPDPVAAPVPADVPVPADSPSLEDSPAEKDPLPPDDVPFDALVREEEEGEEPGQPIEALRMRLQVPSLGSLRSRLPAPSRQATLKVALGVAVLTAAAVVAVLTGPRVFEMLAGGPAPTTLPSPEPTVQPAPAPVLASTTTTTAVASSPPPAAPPAAIHTIFDLPSQQFLGGWNEVAIPVASALRLPTTVVPGAFEERLTEFLTVSGMAEADGTIAEFTISLDPSGPGSSDLLGLQALGVAVALAQPESTGGDRAALLASLGLDVRAPSLDGLDGEAVVDGVAYLLRYDAAGDMLHFTLAPGS